MKAMFLTMLLLLTGWVAALENTLVMRSTQSNLYATVSPGTGVITLHSVEGQTMTSYGSANFLADLALLEGMPGGKQNDVTYSTLRLSSPNFLPTPYGELLTSAAFPAEPTAVEKEAGLKGMRWRVLEAENDFWTKTKDYDGVVRGAMGGQFLLLCVPIKHALLCYDCQDRVKGPQLVIWRNYGIDLRIPQAYNSDPAPQQILNQLPPDVKEEQKANLQKNMDELAKNGGSAVLSPSDPWIASSGGDRWVLVDPPNQQIVTYEYQGKKWVMKSSRSIKMEQLIPTSWRSKPNEQDQYNNYVKSRQKQIAAAGIIPDPAYFKTLVNQKQVDNDKASELQANVTGDELVLDFVKTRKLFAYRISGANNGLELLSVRDYTLDVAFALQDVEFRAENDAKIAWDSAKRFLGKNDDSSAQMAIETALKYDPCLYKKIETDSSYKDVKKLPNWQQTLDDAIKRCQEKEKKLEERRQAAEVARKAAEEARKKK
jgi:hypothetical protein